MGTYAVKFLPTLADEKAAKIAAIKRDAHSLLAPTDWLLIRAAETGKPVPDTVLQWRAAVRQATDRAEQEIATLTDVEAVRSYQPQWPPKPEGV